MAKFHALMGKIRRKKGVKNIANTSRFQRLQGEETGTRQRNEVKKLSIPPREGVQNFVLRSDSSISDISLSEEEMSKGEVRPEARTGGRINVPSSDTAQETALIFDTTEIQKQITQLSQYPNTFHISGSDSSDKDSFVSLKWSDNGDGTISISSKEVKQFILDEDFDLQKKVVDGGTSGAISETLGTCIALAKPLMDRIDSGEETIGATLTTVKTQESEMEKDSKDVESMHDHDVAVESTNAVIEGSDVLSRKDHELYPVTKVQSSTTRQNRVGHIIKMFENSARGVRTIEKSGLYQSDCESPSITKQHPNHQKETNLPRTRPHSENIRVSTGLDSPEFDDLVEVSAKVQEPPDVDHHSEESPVKGSPTFDTIPFNEADSFPVRNRVQPNSSAVSPFPELDASESFTADLVERMSVVQADRQDGQSEKSSTLYNPDDDGYESLLDTHLSQDSSVFHDWNVWHDGDKRLKRLDTRSYEETEPFVFPKDPPVNNVAASKTTVSDNDDDELAPCAVSARRTRSASRAFERLRATFETKTEAGVCLDTTLDMEQQQRTIRLPVEIEQEPISAVDPSTRYQSEPLDCLFSRRNVEETSRPPNPAERCRLETEGEGLPPIDSRPSDEGETPAQIKRTGSDIPFDESSKEPFDRVQIHLMDSRDEDTSFIVKQQHARRSNMGDTSGNLRCDNSCETNLLESESIESPRDFDSSELIDNYERSSDSPKSDDRLFRPSQYRGRKKGQESNEDAHADVDVQEGKKGLRGSPGPSKANRRRKSRKSRDLRSEESDDWAIILMKNLADVRDPCEGGMRLCGVL